MGHDRHSGPNQSLDDLAHGQAALQLHPVATGFFQEALAVDYRISHSGMV